MLNSKEYGLVPKFMALCKVSVVMWKKYEQIEAELIYLCLKFPV